MKIKSLYPVLISLIITCAMANSAERLSLTDGKENNPQSQLTSYKGGNNSLAENKDFTNASQTQIKVAREVTPGEFLQFEGVIRHLGKNRHLAPDFADYMEACANKWQLGMTLDAPKVIEISKQDQLNIAHLKKFMIDILFLEGPFNYDSPVTEEFKKFRNQQISPVDGGYGNSYAMNCFMFSMMYYNGAPIEIKSKNSYNNFTFKFSPSASNSNGEKMNISFQKEELPKSYSRTAKWVSDDTIEVAMSQSGNYNEYHARYKFGISKVDESIYQLMVEFSLQASHRDPYVDQKISNFRIEIGTK